MTFSVLWLFFVAPWPGLQCGIVVFSDHFHLLFNCIQSLKINAEDLHEMVNMFLKSYPLEAKNASMN